MLKNGCRFQVKIWNESLKMIKIKGKFVKNEWKVQKFDQNSWKNIEKQDENGHKIKKNRWKSSKIGQKVQEVDR